MHGLSLAHSEQGSLLFPGLTASKVKRKLVKYLTILGVPAATMVTPGVFRSSRATNLALQGKPLAHILQAGEWRSAAILNYASEDVLDQGAFLCQSIANSDTESEGS